MGLVVRVLTKVANSSAGTSFYKWASGDKEQKLLATALPVTETAIVTATRMATVERQKGMTRREKNMVKRQDGIPALFGILVGSYLNKKVFEFSDSIGKKLDTSQVKNAGKIKSALKVITPIFSTCLLMRLVLPTVAAFMSSKIEDKKEKKLDIKV